MVYGAVLAHVGSAVVRLLGPCRCRSQRLSFLIAFAQYPFDSLHDWHLKILLVAAIIRHPTHIFFQGLQINHSVVAFGIIVTAEPRGDEPRLTDFVMHELVTVDFRNVDCHLGLGRPGGCKGEDGYQRPRRRTSVA
jgi:hypothetical protein